MFKLNIECSKDFEELHITFKDGTSISTGAEEPSEEKKEPRDSPEPARGSRKPLTHYLDTDSEFGGIPESAQNEVVRPPDIPERDRGGNPNVAEELQNMDI